MSQNPNNENSNILKPINDELVDIFKDLAKNNTEHVVNPVFERLSFIGVEIETVRDLELSKAARYDR
jgi:hypothetical protein